MRTILVAILLVAVVYRDVIAKKDDSKCLKTLEKMHRTGICGKLNNKNECANPGMTILSQGGGLCKGYPDKYGCCYDMTYMIKKPTDPPAPPAASAGMPPCQNADKQDIFIILDTAADQSTFNDAKDTIIEFLGRPKISADHTRVGIMAVGKTSSIVSHLNKHPSGDDLITVVDDIARTQKRPRYDLALDLLRTQGFIVSNGDRDTVPNYVLFFVANDQKNKHMNDIMAHIDTLIRDGTDMFSVDMTHGQTGATIVVLFAKPNSNRYSMHASDLSGSKLADDVCAAAPRDITIPIAPVPVQACKIDLYIVIDYSTENSEDVFNDAMEALKALINVLDIHSDRIRVSICVFCKNTRILVALGEMNTTQLLDAIDGIVQSTMSRHDASKALNKLHKAFENENDRQPDTEFPNVVLFVTNGRTNNHRAMVIGAGRVRQHATFLVLALPRGGGKHRLLDELRNSDGSNVFELEDDNFSVDDIKEAMC